MTEIINQGEGGHKYPVGSYIPAELVQTFGCLLIFHPYLTSYDCSKKLTMCIIKAYDKMFCSKKR